MSGSARRTGWGSACDEEGPAPRRQHILETHLDFILDSESEALGIRPSAGLAIAAVGPPKVYRRFTAVLNLEPWQLAANRQFPEASISP
jgi:hypothetical protein